MVTGAQAMISCLENEGVSVVFGYPGAAILPFYDALSRCGIRHILTRGEQGAGHAANGYARISGRPGVCVATSGPGATNLFTAIATAYSDSVPMVAITGQVATWQLGRDVFQEVDTTGAAEPFTKYSYLIKSPDEIGRVFKEAFHIASTGRKGPVLIDVPVDIQRQMFDFKYPESLSIRGYKPNYAGHPVQIKKVAAALRSSKKPLVCYGGGVFLSGAEKPALRFCEKFGLPAVSTLMGISVMPPGHPLYYGMIGHNGLSSANAAVNNSDLLILIGARVGDRAIDMAPGMGTAVVHIDIDASEIGKNMGTTIPLVGDASEVLDTLIKSDISVSCGAWQDSLGDARRAEACLRRGRGFPLAGALVKSLCEHLPDGCVYVADVGQNQIWSALNFSANGRFMTTGGMGTMGYSIPAAAGAKLASPASTVLAVCGDGAFQMSFGELATLRQHGIDLKIVVVNDGKLGMVREMQLENPSGREMAVDLSGSPDYCAIAAAYGIDHARVTSPGDIDRAVGAMFAKKGLYLIEFVLGREGAI